MCNDTGVYEAGEISIYYDPMIAKLVTHADLHRPIRHNIPFLSALMQCPWQEPWKCPTKLFG